MKKEKERAVSNSEKRQNDNVLFTYEFIYTRVNYYLLVVLFLPTHYEEK
jgi:hypothetical protein